MRFLIFIFALLSVAGCKLHKRLPCGGTHVNLPQETWLHDSSLNMNEFAGIADTVFSSQSCTGNLGSLVADLGFEFAKKFMLDSFGFLPHLALYPCSGLKGNLSSDSFKTSDLFKVIPLKNKIVILEISGRAVDSVLKILAQKGGEPVSGLSMTIFQKEWKTATIGGLPFDSRRTYLVVTTDYLWRGGDGYSMLQHPNLAIHTGKFWHRAVLDGIKKETEENGKLKRRDEQRVISIEE